MKPISVYLIIICTVFFLTSCSQNKHSVEHPSPDLVGSGQVGETAMQLNGIIILPTAHNLIRTEFNTAEYEALDAGAQALTALLEEYFLNDQKVTLLNSTQVDNYRGPFIGTPLQEARYIGMQANADAVLITTIYRFRELDGKEFGADEPASVSFDFQLIHLESGITLCKGSFEETQQTLLSNLLKFGKASKRKFKFVTGSALLKEGLDDKFSQCSHLEQ